MEIIKFTLYSVLFLLLLLTVIAFLRAEYLERKEPFITKPAPRNFTGYELSAIYEYKLRTKAKEFKEWLWLYNKKS